MKKISQLISILFIALFIVGCDQYPVPEVQYKEMLYKPTRIWGTDQHSAFADLVRFNNAFYCAFREAPGHLTSGGVIRILKSADGSNWELVQTLLLESPQAPPSSDLEFNGVNQYMTIAHHSDFDFANGESYSISAWINQENASRSAYTQIVSTRNGGDGYDFALQENRLKYDFANPYLRTEQADQDVITQGNWHHVSITYNGASKEIKLYQNGVVSSLNTATATFYPTTPVTTQANTYGNHITVFAKAANKAAAVSGGFTKGKISTLRFWNKALSEAEVTGDMTAEVTAATPNLVAAYDFSKKEEDGTNIMIPDIKGKHPGKLYNFKGTEASLSDLRDPKLSVTPDNRLMVLMDGEFLSGTTIVSRRPYVSYSDANGENFSEPIRSDVHYPTNDGLSDTNFWIWKAKWQNGSMYGVDYLSKFVLFKSDDAGKTFRTHQILDRARLGNPSEVDICFDKNDKMYAFIRRNGTNNALETSKGYLATALPPYTEWEYNELDYRLEGQNVLFLDENTFCIGTRRWNADNAYPQMGVLVTDLTGKVKKEIVLRSAGDCSYPGMVVFEDKLWVVYYSSHEGASCIYFAKIPLSDLLD